MKVMDNVIKIECFFGKENWWSSKLLKFKESGLKMEYWKFIKSLSLNKENCDCDHGLRDVRLQLG